MFFTKICAVCMYVCMYVLQTKPNKANWKYDSDNDIGLDVKRDLDENLLGSVLLQESTESEVCYMMQMRWIWGVIQTEI